MCQKILMEYVNAKPVRTIGGGVWSELANGYCVACWDKGYGFKKGDLQLGYRNRTKENYVDSE